MIVRQPSGDARNALVVSFLFYSAIGAATVYQHWAGAEGSIYGGCRAGVLVLLVAMLHLAGYSLYRDQRGWERLRGVWRSVIFQQVVVLLMCSVLLVSQLTQYVVAIAAAYWVMVGMIVMRRPALAGGGDWVAVRFGFIGMLLGGIFVVDALAVLMRLRF